MADPVAEVLAEVANVLYEHRYGYWTDEHGWEWAGCQGCEWGRDARIARGPGYDSHRLHQADALRAKGLVVSETEWGVRLGDERMNAGTYSTRERAERGIATWVREGRNDLAPALLMTRGVTPWRTADEGSERG